MHSQVGGGCISVSIKHERIITDEPTNNGQLSYADTTNPYFLGKFGQKIVTDRSIVVQNLPEDPVEFYKDLHNVDISPIKGTGVDHATRTFGYLISADKNVENLQASLPIHLSVFILAYSRVKMSKVMRHVNGYYDPKHTLLYTDTDSLIVRKSTFNMMKEKFIGE